jgi:hypothetical protein
MILSPKLGGAQALLSGRKLIDRKPESPLAAACSLLLFDTYVVVFITTTRESLSDTIESALINVVPAVGLAALLHLFARLHVSTIRQPLPTSY